MITDEQVSRIHALRTEKYTPWAIGRRLGLTTEQVRTVLGERARHRQFSDRDIAMMRERRVSGESLDSIASVFRCHRNTIKTYLVDVHPPSDLKRKAQQRFVGLGELYKVARRERRLRYLTPEIPQVPKWVPDKLIGVYINIAERDCEEAAASAVRKLKNSGSVQCR